MLDGEDRGKLSEVELAYGVAAPFGAGVDTVRLHFSLFAEPAHNCTLIIFVDRR